MEKTKELATRMMQAMNLVVLVTDSSNGHEYGIDNRRDAEEFVSYDEENVYIIEQELFNLPHHAFTNDHLWKMLDGKILTFINETPCDNMREFEKRSYRSPVERLFESAHINTNEF